VAGKYASVIDSLPRILGTEPAYQEKVQAVKDSIIGDFPYASDLAREYAGLRAEKARAEDVVSDINLRLEAVAQLLTDQYEAEGTSMLRLEDGQSVSVQYEPYAQVVDKEAFRLWCLAQGLERSMALPWQTTNSLTKTRLLEGEPEPDGITATARTKIVLRKA
jgi:hypothetical protein